MIRWECPAGHPQLPGVEIPDDVGPLLECPNCGSQLVRIVYYAAVDTDEAIESVARVLYRLAGMGAPGRSVGDDAWKAYTWDELPECREPWQERYREQAREILSALRPPSGVG